MYVFHPPTSLLIENECKDTLTMQMKALVNNLY